jgi:TolB-like protein/Tfp pilus assembly protein PilF
MDAEPISFGPFALGDGTLARDGKSIAVGQRALALLEALASADGPVTKADLIEAAWPGTIVEEGNLTVQIAALRKALGTRRDGQEWIVTVPRVGYRLLRETRPAESAGQAWTMPTLAVMPFQNLSGDLEQEYFADGVVEDIITALSRFKLFAVISRHSSFVYRGRAVDVRTVAAELGVRYILEGSVRKAGDRLRIAAQLVDGVSGANLWSEQFEGDAQDIFDFQDRITESVVPVVQPQVLRAEIARSRRERPGSLAAYDLYLRALPYTMASTPSDTTEALALLDKAVELEPNNPTYLSLAASTLRARFLHGWSPFAEEDRARCAEYVERALHFAPDDATVLAHCANALAQGLKQYDRGMELARLAVEANPHNLHAVNVAGIVSLHCGDLFEALDYFHRVLRLSPRDPEATWPLTAIAHVHMALRDYPEALRWAEKSRALNPHVSPTLWMLIAANAQLGRMDEARRFVDELRLTSPGTTVSDIKAGQPDRDPSRMESILDGLRLAGLPE